MKSIKRKGFTLVELLIVIVVIGILSAMMMMSSTEAVTSAKASNAVSNLRNLKTAALALYTDNLDDYNKSTPDTPTKEKVFKYLNSGVNIADSKDYSIVIGTEDMEGSWFLKYRISGTTDEVRRIKDKLKGRAGSTGLLANSTSSKDKYAGDSTDVYVYVR